MKSKIFRTIRLILLQDDKGTVIPFVPPTPFEDGNDVDEHYICQNCNKIYPGIITVEF